MNTPITGEQYDIVAGPYAATVTELGAGLRALSRDERPLVLSCAADRLPPAASGQLLIPWPNRIDHGRYTFAGESHRLTITEPATDNAIHGLLRWATWTAAEQAADRVRLTHRLRGRPGYPFCLDLTAEYALDATTGLTVTLSARNVGSRTAPYGHGAHPYLTLGRPLEECELTVAAGRYLTTDDRAVPDGPPRDVTGTSYDFRAPRRIGDTELDTAYTDVVRDEGRARVRLSDGTSSVTMWADEAHPWLQVYTGDDTPPELRRAGLGAEPMTCPPNAFVSGVDLIELKPDAKFAASWGITAD